MTAEQLWAEFCEKSGTDPDTEYEAWAFGDDSETADELAELVATGKKFGTASSYDDYVAEDALDELPKPGDYSVILNGRDEAVCVIRDYDVDVFPFKEVPPSHAYAEGEGDRSLEYWRKVHREFFTECAKESGIPFSDDSLVICEKFKVEYLPDRSRLSQPDRR